MVQNASTAELLTPHHISICILTRLHLDPSNIAPWILPATIRDLGQLLLKLIDGADGLYKPSLQEFIYTVREGVPDLPQAAAVRQILVDRGLEQLKCPDGLETFFMELVQHLILLINPEQSSGADLLSVIGLFVRRCHVVYSALPFEDVCRLFKEVKAYLAAYKAVPRNDEDLHAYLPDLANANPHIIEREMGRRPRGPLKEALAQLARRMPELATSRILHHTYATLNQDYFVAVQELHRHFDLYQGVAERKGQGLWNQLAEPEWARFQVGLLSLAAMHAHMGHMGEALISLNEAVRIAQKRTDNTALAHILAELCRILWLAAPPVGPSPFISGVAPATSAHLLQLLRLLHRCFRRGMELKEPHLAMYAQVTLAAFRLRYKVDPLLSHRAATEPSDNALDCVGVTEMSTTLQQLRDVNIYKLTTKMMRVTPPPPPVPPPAPGNAGPPPRNAVAEMIVGPLVVPGLATLLDPAAVSDNVDQLAVSGLLVQSAFWQRKGNPEMARAACLELLASHSDTASVEDQCLAYSHLAQSVADSQGYADAAKVLEIVDKEFPYQTNRPLEATRLGVAHDLAVRRKDLQYSKQLAAQISGLASMSNALDLDLRVEGERRAVLSLWASGRLEEAAFAAQSLFSMCLKSGSQVEAVKVLMMVGDLMMEAGTPFLALPYYLSCTHHASVFQVPLLDAEASMKVGLVGLALGPAVAPSARRLIYESLPMLMGAAPLALKAQAYMAHADVMLTSSSLEDILAQPERVMEPLGAAADIYYGLQDWAGAAKAVHLLAVLHHKCGLLEVRDTLALKYHALCAQSMMA